MDLESSFVEQAGSFFRVSREGGIEEFYGRFLFLEIGYFLFFFFFAIRILIFVSINNHSWIDKDCNLNRNPLRSKNRLSIGSIFCNFIVISNGR